MRLMEANGVYAMSNEIDWKAALDGTKPVTTRDGRKVTLYCIDAPGEYPVHGRIDTADSRDGLPYGWKSDGTFGSSVMQNLDLIQPEVKHTITGWVNVYEDGFINGIFYTSKEKAKTCASAIRVACVPVTITYTEGEGLD